MTMKLNLNLNWLFGLSRSCQSNVRATGVSGGSDGEYNLARPTARSVHLEETALKESRKGILPLFPFHAANAPSNV